MKGLIALVLIVLAFWAAARFLSRIKPSAPTTPARASAYTQVWLDAATGEPTSPFRQVGDRAISGRRKMRFMIEYCDIFGVVTSRIIQPHATRQGENCVYIEAFCELREDNRTFLNERITKALDIQTGITVRNLAEYLDEMLRNR